MRRGNPKKVHKMRLLGMYVPMVCQKDSGQCQWAMFEMNVLSWQGKALQCETSCLLLGSGYLYKLTHSNVCIFSKSSRFLIRKKDAVAVQLLFVLDDVHGQATSSPDVGQVSHATASPLASPAVECTLIVCVRQVSQATASPYAGRVSHATASPWASHALSVWIVIVLIMSVLLGPMVHLSPLPWFFVIVW